jgi:signal transduction histidine kinase
VAHGGTLDIVDRAPGQTGSCFRLTLPAVKSSEARP